jgi:hypothetical protein
MNKNSTLPLKTDEQSMKKKTVFTSTKGLEGVLVLVEEGVL